MVGENGPWTRQSEAFWQAHREAWRRSDLNQRQYCEPAGIPLKAFGNWRANIKAEPQPPERKLLYRGRGLRPCCLRTSRYIWRWASSTCAKGIDGLAGAGLLQENPFTGHLFVSRGRSRANLIKIIYWGGTGFCLFTKRLEHGVCLWPPSVKPEETLLLTSAQLSLLIEGVDWRVPEQR